MRNIYDALRESHVLQRTLCRRLTRPGRTSAARQEIFTSLRAELMAHAAAEERFLHSLCFLLRLSIAHAPQHHQIDELLEDLAVHDKSGVAWMSTARKLSEKVHHHLREEEKKFFQVSGRMLTERQKRQLLGRYERDYHRLKVKYQNP